MASAHSDHSDHTRGIGRNLKIALGLLALVWSLSFLQPLAPLNAHLHAYLSMMWWAVLLGLMIGGLIAYFVPDGVLMRLLGPQQRLSLLYAVIAGFLMSACSHGILAIAMQLYRKGASVPAVMAFLLAAPWANLPVTILLFGFFGWRALWFVFGAMLIALVTGLAFTLLDRMGWVEGAFPGAKVEDVHWKRVRNFQWLPALKGVGSGALSLANMVLWWIIIGVLIAACIGAYVPADLFVEYMGPDASGVLVTLLAGTVIEVCSEGSAPLAFEIFSNTGVLGNPFVFLMAGVATDYTEVGLIWSNMGRRAALWLPVVAVPQILLAGVLLNGLA